MIQKAFAVYDSKSLLYGSPMFINSTGAAVRSFSDVANNPDSLVCKHPTDFVLFQIGEYDDEKGVLTALVPFVNLGLASDFKKVTKAPVVYQPAASEMKSSKEK